MVEKPQSGEILGIPYNFERPNLGRMLAAYWKPDDSMLVKKPFGIGYTLNLANWRSWIVLGVAGLLLYQQRASTTHEEGESEEEPVEVVVD